ncbi:MAG: hypothetical protein RL701_5355 [Pseudomonadota bacterium]
MNLFQSLVLLLFSVLFALTVSAGMRGTVRMRIVVFWSSLWVLGSVAIVWPRSTALLARALGIGRGADLVLYSSVLVMIVAFFYTYTRFKRVERQLTLLVRRLAIQNAEQPVHLVHKPAEPMGGAGSASDLGGGRF